MDKTSTAPLASRLLAGTIALLLVVEPIAANAQVVAAVGATAPKVEAAANGVPLVRIVTPNGAGVSHNLFNEYNVSGQGLILNNSATIVSTQLGGYIAGNANLAGGGARIILNEVTGTSASTLVGYTEVAGQKAEVVVANPNGITCNGCGFINTSRGVLTTGTPVFGGSGSLDAFRVTGGRIGVGANGINGGNLDQLDLIARSISVGGDVDANNLNVVAGANRVGYSDLATTTIAGSGSFSGAAIDVASLGGMYANKIHLISTEAGIGVNSQGTLAAQSGEFRLDAAGKVTLGGRTNATGDIVVTTTGDVEQSGTFYAGGNASVSSAGKIISGGFTAANGNLSLASASLDATGTLAAGMDADGNVAGSGALQASTTSVLKATGTNLAGGRITFSGSSLNLAGATIVTDGNVNLTASSGGIDLGTGVLQSGSRIAIVAANDVTSRGSVYAGSDLSVQAGGAVTQSGLLAAKGDASISAASLAASGTLVAGMDTAGNVTGSGVLDVSTSGQLSSTGKNLAGSDIVLSGSTLYLTGATTVANGNADLTAARGGIDLGSGTLQSGNRIALAAATDLTNRGSVYAGSDLSVQAGGAVTQSGLFAAKGNVAIGAALLDASGTLAAGMDTEGTLSGTGSLIATTSGALKAGGGNYAAGDVALSGDSLDLAGATTIANGDIDLTARTGNVDSRAGTVASGGRIAVAAARDLDNDNGQLYAGTVLDVSAVRLSNRGGEIVQLGSGTGQVVASADLDNTAGLIAANGDLRVEASSLTNAGGALQTQNGGNLTIDADSLDNRSGEIVSTSGNAALDVLGALNNGNGDIAAGRDVRTTAASLDNTGGSVYAMRDASIATDTLTGDGSVVAERDLAMSLSGDYTQTIGNTLQGNRNLDLTVGGTLTNQGVLAAVNQLTVHAARLDNQSGATIEADSSSLSANESLTNVGVVVGDTLVVNTPTLLNTGSMFGQDITVNATNFTNQGTGVVAAGSTLSFYVTDTLANLDGGFIYSNGSLAIAADATRDAGGWLATRTAHLINSSADIQAAGDVEISASLIDNKRTSIVTGTQTVSSSTRLVQNKDGDWSYSSLGTYINGTNLKVTTTKVSCNSIGQNCRTRTTFEYVDVNLWNYRDISLLGTKTTGPVEVCVVQNYCEQVTTTTTAELYTPYGYDYWHVSDAASIPTFTVEDLNSTDRRYAFVTEQLQDSATASAESHIFGRNIRIDADIVNNDASRIEAASAYGGRVGSYNATAYELGSRSRTTTWAGGCSDIKNDIAGRLGYCNGGWIWTASVSESATTADPAISMSATATGSSTFTLDATTVNNSTVDAKGLPVGSINPGDSGATFTSPTATPVGAGAADTATGYAAPPYTFTLPGNGLYSVHTGGSGNYLVETDPRFTQYANFIGSDYLLEKLGLDVAATEKRLGDAFYEQQMVRDQLLNLRGKTDYQFGSNLNAEYMALLDAGIAYAQAFELAPGVRLTQDQVSQLSHDMVWLEERQVAGQNVLVPVVYLTANTATPTLGALMGGGNNTSITATDINNLGGTITGRTLKLQAGNDLVNTSGLIKGQDVLLSAGHDIKIDTATRSVDFAPGQTFTAEGKAGRVEAGNLAMVAGNDLTLQGGAVKADSAYLQAGNDLTVGSQSISTEQHVTGEGREGGARYDRSQVEQRGSSLDIKTDLTLVAGNDLTVAGSNVNAGNSLVAAAGNNLNIVTARETDSLAYEAHSKDVDDIRQSWRDTGRASTLTAGGSTVLLAGNNLVVEGSQVQADGKLSATAGNDVYLLSGEDVQESHSTFMRRDESNFGLGRESWKTDIDALKVHQNASTLSGAEVDIHAGNNLVVQASDITSDGKLNLDADNQIYLMAATEVDQYSERTEYKNNLLGWDTVSQPIQGTNSLQNGAGFVTHKSFVSPGRAVASLNTEDSTAGRTAAKSHLSGGEVTLRSGSDTTLQATVINAETLNIRAGQDQDGNVVDEYARINMLGVKESQSSQSGHDQHATFWDNIANVGGYNETLALPEINLSGKTEDGSPVKPLLQAEGGLTVGATALAPTQYETLKAQEQAQAMSSDDNASASDGESTGSTESTPRSKAQTAPLPDPEWQCTKTARGVETCGWVTPPDLTLRSQAEVLAKAPGLEWLADVAKRDDVDWQKVELASQNWDYHHAGLTKEGAAVVVIVVAILTWGAGSSATGAAAGETTTVAGAGGAATTTTSVAGTTLSTTTTAVAADGALVTTTAYTAAGAALNAGFTSLVTQATLSLANNHGDIGATLKDLGSKESIKQTVAAMLTAGVGAAYAGTYNVESFLAKTAAGCAAGELTGSSCEKGATQAAVIAGLQWGSDAMRQNQIESSSQFKGICDSSGKCLTNLSGPSAGVNGDLLKVGGGRIEMESVCKVAEILCKDDSNNFTGALNPRYLDSTGTGQINLPLGETLTNGQPLTCENLIAALPRSPLGGLQGSTGQLGIFGYTFDYAPNSFPDKVVESFAGPHDFLNSFHYYGADGNIANAAGIWGYEFWNTIDVGLAAPFGLSTLCAQFPGFCTNTWNAIRSTQDQSVKSPSVAQATSSNTQ